MWLWNPHSRPEVEAHSKLKFEQYHMMGDMVNATPSHHKINLEHDICKQSDGFHESFSSFSLFLSFPLSFSLSPSSLPPSPLLVEEETRRKKNQKHLLFTGYLVWTKHTIFYIPLTSHKHSYLILHEIWISHPILHGKQLRLREFKHHE